MMFEHVGHGPAQVSRSRGLKRRTTWSEKKLWAELRKLNANFRRQAPIGRYFADFASHGAKLIIEVDGGVHERLPEVAARDAERQRWLESQGYRVVRFTDREVTGDVYGCAERVKALLLDGGGLGGGEAAEATEGLRWAPMPDSAIHPDALLTPPSPTLPPSRRKGEHDRSADQTIEAPK